MHSTAASGVSGGISPWKTLWIEGDAICGINCGSVSYYLWLNSVALAFLLNDKVLVEQEQYVVVYRT